MPCVGQPGWLSRSVSVDVYVHWHLAPGHDAVVGHGSPHLSQGQLFRVGAGVLVKIGFERTQVAAFGAELRGPRGGIGAERLFLTSRERSR